MSNRLITLIGLPGIGKTSLSKNAIHFISTRKMFKAGIVFMQLKGCSNCEIFLKKLLSFLLIQQTDNSMEKKLQGTTE